MTIPLSTIRRFWLVSYYPAALALAPWEVRRRHSRVRLFLDPGESAAFVESVWQSPGWRLLSEAEVERTGLGFVHRLPF